MSMSYASGVPHPLNARTSGALADLRRVKWDDVRVMLLVAECGSFRGGTVIAGVSLNTARAAVARLERVYQEALLIRSVEGVSLTERGREVAAAADQMRAAVLHTLK